MHDPDPQEIGTYEIFRKLASGGMAELFLAKQIGLDGFEKVVVLKQIHDDLASDASFLTMFLDEARLVARLSHPNIVQIYDLGKTGESYFIAMEYVPGRNLAAIAAKAKKLGVALQPEYVARCMADVAAGLHHAHTRADPEGRPLEIVHRDVSPQNVLVSFSGAVKLCDFGIARAATQLANTRTGVLKGKFSYMSPEQVNAEKLDARTDIFAAGIVLYELLTGKAPFDRGNAIITLNAIANEDPPYCRTLNPAIPERLAAIVHRALEKRRGKRWRSAQELQLALEDFVAGTGKRCDATSIGKWVTELFADEIPLESPGQLAADAALALHFEDRTDEDEEATFNGVDDISTANAIPAFDDKTENGEVFDKPTLIVPDDATTIQPKTAIPAQAVADTDIAPFHAAPTAHLPKRPPIVPEKAVAVFDPDRTSDRARAAGPVGRIANMSTGALLEAADGEEGFEVEFSRLTGGPQDPADLLANVPVSFAEGTDREEEEEEDEESARLSAWDAALAAAGSGSAEGARPRERERVAVSRVPEIAGLNLDLESTDPEEPAEPASGDHQISEAFAAFSIDDEPIAAKELTAEPLPLDALISEAPPAAKGKRNIVEVHRPGPAAPTEFFAGGAEGDMMRVDTKAIARLPAIVRERQTPAPQIVELPPEEKGRPK